MDLQGFGRVLITVGAVVLLIGILPTFGQRFRLGHLPGDIVVRRGHVKIYVPITTMAITSLALTIILNVIFRIFHR